MTRGEALALSRVAHVEQCFFRLLGLLQTAMPPDIATALQPGLDKLLADLLHPPKTRELEDEVGHEDP